MKNASHNTNYLLHCSRFKLPQRSHVLLLQSGSYGEHVSQKLQAEYQHFIKEHCADIKPSCLEDAWNNLKDCLLSGVNKVCGKTKGG